MRLFASLLAVGGLTACATGPSLPVNPEPIAMQFQTKQATQKIHRLDTVLVRTILRDGGNWREIGPVPCQIKGRGYQANFIAPALLNVPTYRGRTDDIRIQCRTKLGQKMRVSGKTVKAKNLDAPDGEGVSITVGTGGILTQAVVSIRDRKKDRFDYPRTVTIVFAP